MTKELTFEEALNRLNEITTLIQKNECSLDEGFKLFEEGIALSRFCSETLKEYQAKLDSLTEELEKKDD